MDVTSVPLKEGCMDKRHQLLAVLGRTTEGACAEGKAILAGPEGRVSRKGRKEDQPLLQRGR